MMAGHSVDIPSMYTPVYYYPAVTSNRRPVVSEEIHSTRYQHRAEHWVEKCMFFETPTSLCLRVDLGTVTRHPPWLGMLIQNLTQRAASTPVEVLRIEFTQHRYARSYMSSGIWNGDLLKDLRQALLHPLFGNRSIKHLILDPSFFSGLVEDDFKLVMSLLQVNFTLEQIELGCDEWERDGKTALVREALNRNARQADYFSQVIEAGLKFERAKGGRILLCGAPYAGKTRLTKAMLEIAGRRPGFFNYFKRKVPTPLKSNVSSKLSRTTGIDITVLRDDEQMQISVWDLAGQKIFRVLQGLLFPVTGEVSILLYAFSPFDVVNGILRKKRQLESAFRKDLTSWLRFIASNSQCTGGVPPQTLVVISHKDKVEAYERSVGWAKLIVDELRTKFQGIVDLCSGQEVHFINSFDSEEVSALMKFVFQRLDQSLTQHNHIVPQPAAAITGVLARRPDIVRQCPIWSSSEFYSYFGEKIEGLSAITPNSATGRMIWEALSRYLHDVGSIIIVPGVAPDSHLVVVDPNWFTSKFLGELINRADHLEAKKKKFHFQNLSVVEDGFVGLHKLDSLLSALQNNFAKQGVQVHREDIQKILFELNLCFQLTDVDVELRYFMPAIFGEPDAELTATHLKWSDTSGRNHDLKDFGFRLQCSDRERTCLTESFFPLFQVHLWNRLVKVQMFEEKNVVCRREIMEIREDGHEIFIESDGMAGDHIDILVRCSPQRSKEETEAFVLEKIVNPMRSFCASEMGCPGVSLSLHVLRTECVTMLTPRHHRGDEQAVSVERLKLKLMDDARKTVPLRNQQQMLIDNWIESSLQYTHWWPPAAEVPLPRAPELARELLTVTVVEEIRTELKSFARCSNLSNQLRTDERQIIRLNDEVFEIYAPLEDYPKLELVFVHGLLEDETDQKPYLSTWSTRNDRQECWLNTWLVSYPELQQARVLTVSYDSSVRKSDNRGNMDCFLTAENLAGSLVKLAKVGQHCPVVLVAHSLGGLVVKGICVQAVLNLLSLDEKMYTSFLENLRGLFFFSTPHLGTTSNLLELSDTGQSSYLESAQKTELMETYITLYEKLQALCFYSIPMFTPSDDDPHAPAATNAASPTYRSEAHKGDLMSCLRSWDKHTSRLNAEFANIQRRYGWKTRGVGESITTKTSKQQDPASSSVREIISQEASSRSGMDVFTVIPDTDHFSICRPDRRNSSSLLYLVEFIKDLIT